MDTGDSSYQVGVPIFQTDKDKSRQPLEFRSKTLQNHEWNYPVSEKEFLAVVWSLSVLLPYLIFENFIVNTDHSILLWLINVTDAVECMIRWRLHLSEFDFEIKYRKVICNSQDHELSRLTTE